MGINKIVAIIVLIVSAIAWTGCSKQGIDIYTDTVGELHR